MWCSRPCLALYLDGHTVEERRTHTLMLEDNTLELSAVEKAEICAAKK